MPCHCLVSLGATVARPSGCVWFQSPSCINARYVLFFFLVNNAWTTELGQSCVLYQGNLLASNTSWTHCVRNFKLIYLVRQGNGMEPSREAVKPCNKVSIVLATLQYGSAAWRATRLPNFYFFLSCFKSRATVVSSSNSDRDDDLHWGKILNWSSIRQSIGSTREYSRRNVSVALRRVIAFFLFG